MINNLNVHIERVMTEHGEYLIRLAYFYVKDWNAAEDIVQDTFLRYYQKSHQFEGKSSLKTYLCKITVNRCYDYLRSWKNKKANFSNVLVELLPTRTNPESDAIYNADISELVKEIMNLPIKYREVILLYYYQELTIVEISVVLNCTETTIKTRLSRARNKLKSLLNEKDLEGINYESN